MVKLKRIGVLSAATMYALIMVVFGFIIGLFYLPMLMVLPVSTSPFPVAGALLVVLLLVGMPIMYGTIGFISGLIMAALYNIFVKWTGGVDLEFEQ